MFDVLVYLFETYYTPQACPEPDALAAKLTAAGFEEEEIDEALDWLSGLATATQEAVPLTFLRPESVRIYTDQEWHVLGSDGIGFISFMETSGSLSPTLREIVIDRASAVSEPPISLDKLKVIVLMVLWSQEAEIDNLILDELLETEEERLLH